MKMRNWTTLFRASGHHLLMSVFTLFLIGCAEDNAFNPGETVVDDDSVFIYAGLWYLEESDYYLEINNKAQARFYSCSVNSGYLPVEGEQVGFQDNLISITPFADEPNYLSIERIGNSLLLSYIEFPDTQPLEFVKRPELPISCDSDSVQIISITKRKNELGLVREISVEVDYRLASFPKVQLELELMDNNDAVLGSQIFTVDIEDLKSGTAIMTFPVEVGDGDRFMLKFYALGFIDNLQKYYVLGNNTKLIGLPTEIAN